MSDRVLVTGISGFLGGHVALKLLQNGYTVRGSVRKPDKADQVRKTMAAHGADINRLEFATLDLENDAGWREAMADVTYVQHVASPFNLQTPTDKMELIRPAVGGTERAIRAALGSGVKRIVLTSSMAAIAYGYPKSRTTPFSTADWTQLNGPVYVAAYPESKTLAERRAWELMAEASRTDDLVTINPAGIMGPVLDKDPGTTAALILGLLNGSIPAMPPIESPIVDVRDIAEAHLQAMIKPGAGGKRFPFCESTLPFSEIADLLARNFPGAEVPARQVPAWLIRLLAPFNKDMRNISTELGYHRVMETASATSLIGRPLIPAREAIIATGKSLIEQGLLSLNAGPK